DADHICLGGVTHTAGGSDGMFVSHDGALNWGRQTFPGSGPYRCHSIVFHPTVRDTLFATISARGTQSGIWKSTNGGSSCKQSASLLARTSVLDTPPLATPRTMTSIPFFLSRPQPDVVVPDLTKKSGGGGCPGVVGEKGVGGGQLGWGRLV